MGNLTTLMRQDPVVAQLIKDELQRQQNHIELIASENFVSSAVLEAQGSILTNKYAEGYPDARYYGGCAYVDKIEHLAIERACELFQCGYANVQPHSGCQANQAVFLALLAPGDTFLGMALEAGGHLTHGAKPTLSGKWFQPFHYGVDPHTHLIDYQQVQQLAQAHRPKLIIAGGSSYARTIDFEAFRAIADDVGAYLMVDMAHFAGLVAAGVYPNPLPHAHVVTTTTHKTLRGPRGGMILSNFPEIGKKINSAVFPGIQGGPLMHIIAAKAVCFQEALTPAFQEYGQQILKNAKALSQTLQEGGLSLLTKGTDSHLMLVDVSAQGLTGADAEKALQKAGITCNKNSIPFDSLPPKQASGVRLGVPAETTRGLKEQEFKKLGLWIVDILKAMKTDQEDNVILNVQDKVTQLCNTFPLYS